MTETDPALCSGATSSSGLNSSDDLIVDPYWIKIGFPAMHYAVSDHINRVCTCNSPRTHSSGIHPGEYHVGSLAVISRSHFFLRDDVPLVEQKQFRWCADWLNYAAHQF